MNANTQQRTAVVIVTAVVGGVALLGSGAGAAVAAASDLSRSDYAQTVAVDGVESLLVDVGGSAVTVGFGDVSDARLEVFGGRAGAWALERDDEELVLRSPDRGFGWLGWGFGNGGFGNWGWGDWGLGDGGASDEHRVVLTLPKRLGGLDAELHLGAGSLDVDGEFGELSAEVGAGALFLDGSARTLDADLSAGRAEIELADVAEAAFTIAAARITGALTGAAPDAVDVDVTAGSLDLTLPAETYRVTQDVSAGSFDNGLDTASNSRHTVDVTVAVGDARLTAAD